MLNSFKQPQAKLNLDVRIKTNLDVVKTFCVKTYMKVTVFSKNVLIPSKVKIGSRKNSGRLVPLDV